MAEVNKIDANTTGLSFAYEATPNVLPGTPIWIPMEPNSYNNFGGSLTRLTREPITTGRQKKKGVISDLEAAGSWNQDLTQNNLAALLPAFFFADYRLKGEAKNAIGTTTNTFSMTATGSVFTRVGGTIDLSAQFAVGDMVHITGFADPANNGVFVVDALSATTLDLADVVTGTASTLVDEAATANAGAVKVGIEGDAADIVVDSSATLPALTSTTYDFTTLGIIPGEWVYIGGDNATSSFATAANNGYARVRSVAANRVVFDKTEATWVTDAGTGKQIHIYVGRVLKNETGTLITKKYLQLERQLGAPDDASPGDVQSEYLTGALANEFTMQVPTANKVNLDVSVVASTSETRNSTLGVKAGTRVTAAAITGDAINTSTDVPRIKLHAIDPVNSNPSPLFAYAENLSITVNNGVTPDKAVGVLGGFDTSIGDFAVTGDLTVYFANVAAVEAVRANADVTLDYHLVAENAGISVDIPLIALGNAQVDIQAGTSIKLPLSAEAATAESIDTNLNHTLLIVFFDYLPNAAG